MKETTDPYGKLEWCIGSADDFWCFDYAVNGNKYTLHAVINSETGHFIMDAYPPETVSRSKAIEAARDLVYSAIDWICGNDIKHDAEGWNQDLQYFVRCVERSVKKSKKPVERLAL